MSELCRQGIPYCGGCKKKMSDAQMSLFAVEGYIEFYCQEKSVNFFCVCRPKVGRASKQETCLKRKSDR